MERHMLTFSTDACFSDNDVNKSVGEFTDG